VTSITGLPAVDVAIGLSFIYLVLSLLSSTVQEWIASILALRARTLEQGLISMLSEDDAIPTGLQSDLTGTGAERNLVADLYGHPLIATLYRSTRVPFKPGSQPWTRGRLPSYISPHVFAVALTDILSAGDEATSLEEKIKALSIPASVKYKLLTLLSQAGNDITQFRAHLESWFDDTMARVSGWYKRNTQLILAAIALVVTIALNANTLTIGQRLWKDPTVRAAVVQQATSPSVTGQPTGSTPQARLNNAANNVDAVAKLDVPLGWSSKASDPRHVSFTTVGQVFTVLGGWLLTIIAISLGAPFWFDTLSRLSRLRGSGKPETPLPASGSGKPNERVPAPV
jgi:hypothetical protein